METSRPAVELSMFSTVSETNDCDRVMTLDTDNKGAVLGPSVDSVPKVSGKTMEG